MGNFMAPFQGEEIRSAENLEALKPEWEALWRSCPEATPFQHPMWLIPWWKEFGSDKQLYTLILRARGQLIAVVPFCILCQRSARKLMLLGVGLSDFLDGLFAPGFEQTAALATFVHLIRNGSGWETCDLQPLLGGSALLNASAPESFVSVIDAVDTLTSLELPSKITGFHRLLSQHFLDRLREAARRAERLGPIQYETAERTTFDDSMDHLFRFHQARWRTPLGAAAQFHRQAALAMLERGELRLYRLKIGSRIASVLYGFVHRQRGYLYMTGFDPEFEKISPGVLIITHAIEQLIREEMVSCEFLRGREAYKYRWGVVERTTYARRLQCRHPVGGL